MPHFLWFDLQEARVCFVDLCKYKDFSAKAHFLPLP